jgi:hypothetical protein
LADTDLVVGSLHKAEADLVLLVAV